MMSEEQTTPTSDPINTNLAQAPVESESKSGSPVMLLVILGGLFVALILFGVFVH